MVSTQDKIFFCVDLDDSKIYVAPGLIDEVKKKFPKANFTDKSKEYWKYASIAPVEHKAEPRNQLQKDFIQFVIEHVNKGECKLGGVLSPGTGKGLPVTTKVPNLFGYIKIQDIKIGDKVLGSNGIPTTVTGVYDQGVKDVYKIFFEDGRYALCDLAHLWNVTNNQEGT